MINGVCNVTFLELGKDTVPQQKVTNFLQRVGSKPITDGNASPPRNKVLLSQRQIKYVEDIIVTRHTVNLDMSRREVI